MNVSDVNEGVHTYIPTIGADLALVRLCFWWVRPLAPYKGPPSARCLLSLSGGRCKARERTTLFSENRGEKGRSDLTLRHRTTFISATSW